jgi:hypothetical protein
VEVACNPLLASFDIWSPSSCPGLVLQLQTPSETWPLPGNGLSHASFFRSMCGCGFQLNASHTALPPQGPDQCTRPHGATVPTTRCSPRAAEAQHTMGFPHQAHSTHPQVSAGIKPNAPSHSFGLGGSWGSDGDTVCPLCLWSLGCSSSN